MKKLSIIKVGGHVIDDAPTLKETLLQFAHLPEPKLLIHGGGKIASSISSQLGITPNLVEGRRITDAQTLKVVTMTYGGLVNKNIVAQLQALGCNALGLTGADANVITAKKRINEEIDYGFVGDFNTRDVDIGRLKFFMEGGLTPVFCALTHDQEGNLLNTNADTMASGLASALAAIYRVELIYCFEKPGVLLDSEDEQTLIKDLSYLHYQQLKDDGIIHNGMIPKLDNGFEARQHGVDVFIKNALEINKPGGTVLL